MDFPIDPGARRAMMRVITLLVGVAAAVLGGIAVSEELSAPHLGVDRSFGLVMAGILACSGVAICVLALGRYRGGLVTLLGVLVFAFAIACIVAWMHARHAPSSSATFGLPLIFQATVSAFILLYIGHRQHRALPELRYEARLPRYALMAGAFLLVFSAGVAAGYYWSWRPARLARLEVFRALETEDLQEGNSSLRSLNLIADGHPDRSYLDAEFRVIRQFNSARYLTQGNGRVAQQYADFQAAVVDFYRRHPDRLASLRERFAQHPDLIEGIGGQR